jgi:DNA polymerase III subunit delta
VPQLRPGQLERTLRDPVAGGAFFLSGDEGFLREEAVAAVLTAHLDPATRDFNLDQLRGGETGAEQLASLLATPPMMAERRVVVVRDAQGLSPKAREAVSAFARAPEEGTVLVLSATIPPGSRARFYDELRKHAVSVDFSSLSADDAPGWLMERGRSEHGIEVEPDAARLLVSGMGVELGALASELRKLADYAAERGRVTIEDVRAVGGSVPRVDRWAWFDLVADRRFDAAIERLPVLLDQGETAVGVLIGLSGVLTRVALVRAGGASELERQLSPHQRWLIRRVTPQARRWTLPQLEAALEELLRADRLAKSASLTARQIIEECLLRLWGGASGPLPPSGRSPAAA